MIFDTSIVLQVLKNRSFFESLREKINEEVKITSITAYELLRSAAYIKLRYGRDYEYNLVRNFVNDIEILPFTSRDSEVSAMIWAKLRERGYEVSDADIMISAISIREEEKLITLDRDFEYIRNVAELDVDILKS
ncbi:MAG: type II toxin-antitoxin system VapC family toxin [Archaeoglobaceae archaeon]|nr:type II toxin-antitoxin system VapC family toxin [Archaeoglobaceae archaeon]